MKPPAHKSYKPSDVAWLGDIPDHWEVKRLRFLLVEAFANGLFKKAEFWGEGTRIINVTDLYVDNDLVDEAALKRLECSDDELTTYAAQHGDFFVVRSSLKLEGIGKSAALLNPTEQTVFECHTVRGRPNLDEIHPRFLNLFMNSADARYYFMTHSNIVTMATIDQERIKNLVVPVPSYGEQQQIAAFLDWKTGQIDALIAKKQELLEKLKEKRLAVITQAVTRGLDPAVTLKDSGVLWLGQVPAHWELRRLRFLVRCLDQGWSPQASNAPAEEGENGVLKLSAVSKGTFLPHENKMLDEIPRNQSIQTPCEHDILITRANTPELVGDTCVVKQNFPQLIIPDLIYRLQMERVEADSRFVVSFLLSQGGRAQIESQARGSSGSMVKLGQGHLKDFQIPLPPLSEQRDVAQFIEQASQRIDAIIDTTQAAMSRLIEYRTALITAATTGKIDVRNVKIAVRKQD